MLPQTRSSSSHLPMKRSSPCMGGERMGMVENWLQHWHFTAVPVTFQRGSKGEFAVGYAVPSYMAFAEVLGGYDVMYVYPKNAYVTPEPMAVLKGAPHPKAAHAFIEFLLTEEGQKLFAGLGLYPITPKI